MALTLPYPSMNFVPLDVLTAAEQNQLVANIEYIANQFPITSTNIASQAVKSDNIDWTTLGIGTQVSAGSFSTGSNYDYTTTDPCWLVFSVTASGGSAAEVDIVMNDAIILNAFSNVGGTTNFSQRDTLFIPKGATISCRVFGSGISGTGTFYKATS